MVLEWMNWTAGSMNESRPLREDDRREVIPTERADYVDVDAERVPVWFCDWCGQKIEKASEGVYCVPCGPHHSAAGRDCYDRHIESGSHRSGVEFFEKLKKEAKT